MENGIVYRITNNINNKVYIGITTILLKRRWSAHKRDDKKLKYPLYKSIRKYGIDNFMIKPTLEIECKNKNIRGIEICPNI